MNPALELEPLFVRIIKCWESPRRNSFCSLNRKNTSSLSAPTAQRSGAEKPIWRRNEPHSNSGEPYRNSLLLICSMALIPEKYTNYPIQMILDFILPPPPPTNDTSVPLVLRVPGEPFVRMTCIGNDTHRFDWMNCPDWVRARYQANIQFTAGWEASLLWVLIDYLPPSELCYVTAAELI